MDGVRMLAAGEQGLVVEFGETISAEINVRVHQTARKLTELLGDKIMEVVPTYRSFLVYFNPLVISRQELVAQVENILSQVQQAAHGQTTAKVVKIPVCYDEEFGPDLSFVAAHNGLSVPAVIDIHTSTPYLVYMIGFTPGFPYLGGMSEQIATPRLEKPRTKIPAGSVGIAGSQTGFYPIESPGGWRLIGRTPVKAFMPGQAKPFLFEAGDYLQFQSVTREEYARIEAAVAAGRYAPDVTSLTVGGGRA